MTATVHFWFDPTCPFTWAYHRPEHAATVARQEEHALLPTSGFLRCAVVGSSGTLHGTDPLAGRTGVPVVLEETA